MTAQAGAAPLKPAAPATQPPALPSFFEFLVPEAWQAVDLLSDLHLSEELPRTLAVLETHLLQTPADAVFLLGDVFEVWVGDDSRSHPFIHRCVDLFAEVASRRTLGLMVGNRDFLLGSAMLRDCGAMGLPDPTVLQAWGQRVLLTHGDALCLEDKPYQAFRDQVRSAGWQAEFMAKPLSQRLAIARQMRQASQDRQRFDGDTTTDIDTAAAVRWMHAMGTPELVHGHTHRPGSNTLAPGFKRHVLSDWDLDGAHGAAPRAEVLRLSRDGLRRLPPLGLTG